MGSIMKKIENFIAKHIFEYILIKKICDEVFGAGNFINTVIWENVFGNMKVQQMAP